MTTLKDFLIWYNSLDTEPLLRALSKPIDFYRGLSLGMLKDAIGVPGLTLKYTFKTITDEFQFWLTDEQNKDLHKMMRAELVGGPSIIRKKAKQ